MQGKVTVTISRGRVVWEDGKLSVEPGSGRFVPMAPHGPLFDGLDKLDGGRVGREFPYGSTPVQRAGGEGGAGRNEL